MKHRPVPHRNACLGRNEALAVVIFRTGERKVVRHCFDCRQRSSFYSEAELARLRVDVAELEVVKDNRTPGESARPCEVCGSVVGVQCHHWLPQALENEVSTAPGAWPTVDLCIRCHGEWHRAVTPELVAGNLTMFQLGARRSTTVRELLDAVRAHLRQDKRGTAA